MKNQISIVVCLIVLTSVNSIFGKDRIHLNNGKVIEGNVEKIGVNDVTILIADDKPVYVYAKNEIKVIVFADGSVETFEKFGFLLLDTGVRKTGAIAVGISVIGGAFLPFQGLGQFYNGEYKKGAVFLGLGTISYGIWRNGNVRSDRFGGLVAHFAILVLSAIDAGISAGRINRDLQLSTTQNLDGVILSYSFSLSK